ncbi:MAG: nitroreductase family protein [Parcubacteria group bacterium]
MIIKEILNRRSVREYKEDTVPEKFIIEIIKAGQFAPTARNNRAINFLVVREQKTKEGIFDIIGQEFLKKASALIIPAIDKNKSVAPVQDLSIASENMLLQATALGIGGVWRNIRPEFEEQIKRFLSIPQECQVINAISLGYPANKTEPHTDADFDAAKIHKERW